MFVGNVMKFIKIFLLTGIIFALQNNCHSAEFLEIVGLGVAGAVAYGTMHNLVAANVCLPFFTLGLNGARTKQYWNGPFSGRCRSVLERYPNSPTIHGLVWGAVSGWRVGFPLGLLLGAASQVGPWPTVGASELVKPLAITMGGIGLVALAAGACSYVSPKNRQWFAWEQPKKMHPVHEDDSNPMKGVPIDDRLRWKANSSAQNAAYTAGILSGVGLAVYVLSRRIAG